MNFKHLVMSLSTWAVLTAPAFAQVSTPTPTPAPIIDPRPYQTQTILRMQDGTMQVILPHAVTYTAKCDVYGLNCKETVENAVWLFDKENPLPNTARMGVNYAFMTGNLFVTFPADGSNPQVKGVTTQFKPQSFTAGIMGGNFFTKQGSNELVTIDSYGFYNDTMTSAGNIKIAGGNYYITEDGLLTTIKASGVAPGNSFGQISHYQVPAGIKPEERSQWEFKNVTQVGGQFFMTAEGKMVSVSSITGTFYGPMAVASKPVKMGGNYYIGQDNQLYTTNNDGAFAPHGVLPGVPAVYGYSYIIYMDGSFSVIAGDGSVHSEMIQVSTTGITRKVIKKIDLKKLDLSSVYLPGKV